MYFTFIIIFSILNILFILFTKIYSKCSKMIRYFIYPIGKFTIFSSIAYTTRNRNKKIIIHLI